MAERRALLRALLEELVAVPSVNPPGAEYEQVQQVVARWLERFGVAHEEHRFGGKSNLVARIGGSAGVDAAGGGSAGGVPPVLLLNGHVDVVPAASDGWTSPPFRLASRDGRFYGRGTTDMKGGLAALLIALGEIVRRGGPRRGSLLFTSTVDEETGGHDGLRALLHAGAVRADLALVAEPTELRVVTCEKGVLQQRLRVQGRSAHAATPHLGQNAIELAARAVLHLQAHTSGRHHPLLGGSTLTVGTIQGGQARNVVPDLCELTLDRRLLPGESLESVREEILAALHAAWADLPSPPSYEIEDLLFAEPFETDPEHPLVRAAQAAVQGVRGGPAYVAGLAGFTDARHAAELGIPVVLLGPGSIRQAHQVDEYVDEEQLLDAVEVYVRLFDSLV